MASPFFDPRQIAGHGILGQGLVQQGQSLDGLGQSLVQQAQQPPQQPAQQMPQQPPMPQQSPAMTAPPMPTQPPPRVRPGFTMLDPKDWTPEEHAVYRQAHNIQQAPSVWDQLKQALGAMGGSQAR